MFLYHNRTPQRQWPAFEGCMFPYKQNLYLTTALNPKLFLLIHPFSWAQYHPCHGNYQAQYQPIVLCVFYKILAQRHRKNPWRQLRHNIKAAKDSWRLLPGWTVNPISQTLDKHKSIDHTTPSSCADRELMVGQSLPDSGILLLYSHLG